MIALLNTFAASACTDDNFCTNLPTAGANPGNIHNMLQIVFGILAAVSVVIILNAALNLVMTEGDPAKVTKARSMIVYALIGLAIALAAEFIVTFVLNKF